MSRPLALFDFDNTLTLCDTFVPFVLFAGGPLRFLRSGFLLAVRRLSGSVTRTEAKELMLRGTISGVDVKTLEAIGAKYAGIVQQTVMNDRVLEELVRWRDRGARAIIVSASPELYLQFVTAKLHTELIATRLETREGRITGNLDGENCRGQEKLQRLRAVLTMGDYSLVAAYGDSDGDTEMLEAATEPHLRSGRGPGYYFKKSLSCVYLYLHCVTGGACRRRFP